jgi:hypothetical protein
LREIKSENVKDIEQKTKYKGEIEVTRIKVKKRKRSQKGRMRSKVWQLREEGEKGFRPIVNRLLMR